MHRRYRAAGFLERCRRLRESLDQPAFTTDVIVGFPGETEADFQATCNIVREVGFVHMHVFPFSRRKGTPAAELPDSVAHSVITERKAQLAELEREMAARYMRGLIGRRLEVLVEGPDPERSGWVRGTSCRRVGVAFEGWAPGLIRRLVPVRAIGIDGTVLLARPEAESQRYTLPVLG
jgi:threonylcarbamoyladenosine tRNA methylthiotransferase MtaB